MTSTFFHVPSVVEFGNGSTVVVPRLGTYPDILDYEICDPAIGGRPATWHWYLRRRRNVGGAYYPAYYQQPTSFMQPASSFAPRQMQLSMRLDF
jgi:hypothetical protein